jgi:amidase
MWSNDGVQHSEYLRHDAMALAELVRRRKTTAGELFSIALDRIESVNSSIGAVIERRDVQIRDEDVVGKRGPMAGVPFLVSSAEGAGGKDRANLGERPDLSSARIDVPEIIARYQDAGLVFVGSVGAAASGLVAETSSTSARSLCNPWDSSRVVPGGSGAAAAAVATRIVPAAQIHESIGSLRAPAAACGVFGFTPSRGRQPLSCGVPEAWRMLGQPHVVTRSVRDSAALLDISHGRDLWAPQAEPSAPRSFLLDSLRSPGRLRVGFSTKAFLGRDLHRDSRAAVLDAVELLTRLEHEVVEVELPTKPKELNFAYSTMIAAAVGGQIRRLSEDSDLIVDSRQFDQTTWYLKLLGDSLSATDLQVARDTALGLSHEFSGRFLEAGIDVHLSATLTSPPTYRDTHMPTRLQQAVLASVRRAPNGRVVRSLQSQVGDLIVDSTLNTQVFSMTGQPAMTVPLWWNEEGLPVGVQFAAPFGADARLFRLAGQLEVARSWADRIPPD